MTDVGTTDERLGLEALIEQGAVTLPSDVTHRLDDIVPVDLEEPSIDVLNEIRG